MKSVRERMDINAAYREVGTYLGAADICGTTPKTVKRVVETAERTDQPGLLGLDFWLGGHEEFNQAAEKGIGRISNAHNA